MLATVGAAPVVELSPRSFTSQGGLVVLWIVSDEGLFDNLTDLVEGTDHRVCPRGYVCKVSWITWVELC